MSEKKAALVVDDENTWRAILCDELRKEFIVKEAISYDQAIEMFSNEDPPFYLIVADISLKGGGFDKDGMKLIRYLRDYKIFTSVIIVTGYPSIQTVKDAFKTLEVFEYLEKSQFDVDYFLEKAISAVDDAVKRRKEFSIKRSLNVLIFIEDEDIQNNIFNILAKSDDISLDKVTPGKTINENKELIENKYYDLVITSIDTSDDPENISELLEVIQEFYPEAVVLGVGHYNPSYKVIVNALNRFGVADLIDLNETGKIRKKVRETVMAVEKKYIVASFKDISVEEQLKLNYEYQLIVNVSNLPSQNEATVAIPLELAQNKIIRLNSVISVPTGGFDILPSTNEDIILYSSGEVKPAIFRLIPKTLGRKEITLEFYREGRWQRKLRLERFII